jgi:hypothetical protein
MAAEPTRALPDANAAEYVFIALRRRRVRAGQQNVGNLRDFSDSARAAVRHPGITRSRGLPVPRPRRQGCERLRPTTS